MSRGGVQKRERVREIDGIPGTVEPGFRPRQILPRPLSPSAIASYRAITGSDPFENDLACYEMGPCKIMVAREPAAANGEKLWHLTISTPSRHPSWDEIKVARYHLLPLDLTFGMLLPPPQFYVNVPEQDHVFQLWEITDPRAPWEAM